MDSIVNGMPKSLEDRVPRERKTPLNLPNPTERAPLSPNCEAMSPSAIHTKASLRLLNSGRELRRPGPRRLTIGLCDWLLKGLGVDSRGVRLVCTCWNIMALATSTAMKA